MKYHWDDSKKSSKKLFLGNWREKELIIFKWKHETHPYMDSNVDVLFWIPGL
jgi:hypothetical protein